MSDVDVASAYSECVAITREQAGNFYWGIRLLPAQKRHALSAVYALARRIDDIGDGGLPAADKRRLLAEARASIVDIGAHPDDAVLVALGDAASRLPIPLGAFSELVDGCEMDVDGRSYQDLDELVEYCRCVAGSVGRLSLGVFAPPLAEAERVHAAGLADELGVALQLTNILRDIREDLLNGRTYLPAKDLELFGVRLRVGPDGALDPCDGALAELIRFEAARAWTRYDTGMQLLDLLDRRSAACCAAMAGIYRELLERIAADPRHVMAARMSLPTSTKLQVAGAALVRSARRRRG